MNKMSERKFKEDCYRHFNNKYKESVKELDEKYAHGYRDLYRLQNKVSILESHIAILEYALRELLPEEYEGVRR